MKAILAVYDIDIIINQIYNDCIKLFNSRENSKLFEELKKEFYQILEKFNILDDISSNNVNKLYTMEILFSIPHP